LSLVAAGRRTIEEFKAYKRVCRFFGPLCILQLPYRPRRWLLKLNEMIAMLSRPQHGCFDRPINRFKQTMAHPHLNLESHITVCGR